jgi:hypothetical protein
MKRRIYLTLISIYLLTGLFTAGGAPVNSPAENSLDIVVMVDISASMEPYFQDVTNYFLNNLLKHSLRLEDNFFFLSFSGLPEIQVKSYNVNQNSVENIVNKIRVLQPIGLYTDLILALDFLNQFTSQLDPSRPKLILFLTDGVHEPIPGSINDIDPTKVVDKLLANAKAIKRNGWAIHLLEVPATNLREFTLPQRQNDQSLFDTKSEHSENGSNQSTQNTTQEQKDPESTIRNSQAPNNYLDILAEEMGTKIIPYKESDQNTLTYLNEDISKLREQQPDQANQASNGKTTSNTTPLFGWDLSWLGSIWLGNGNFTPIVYIFLIVLALLLVAILVFFVRNRLPSIQRMLGATKSRRQKQFTRKEVEDGLIQMKVDMQNPYIGLRNILSIAPGSSKSIGGGFSNFLIFLVPVPSRIAEIRYDGVTYTFIPRKKEYFPTLTGEISDCLNKNIPARSRKGFPIIINFHRYISPLTEINRLFSEIIDATKKREETKPA